MTFAAKDGGKHFSGPGSLFLAQKLPTILPLRPYQKKFLQTDFKPNLIQYIGSQKSLLWENELYPYLVFLSPMETN